MEMVCSIVVVVAVDVVAVVVVAIDHPKNPASCK